MKRTILLVAAVALLASMAAWGQGYVLKAPIATKPAFLTSVGQSADIEMVKVLLEKAAVPHKMAAQAKAGDLVRMPRGIPHGYFNKSDKPARALFWVSPARMRRSCWPTPAPP